MKSDCCGVKIIWKKIHAGFDDFGNQHFYNKSVCSRCKKPCQRAKEKK